MTREIVVVGAGGHGRVIAEAASAAGHRVLAFTDVDTRLVHTLVDGVLVMADAEALDKFSPDDIFFVNGMGSISDCRRRRALDEKWLGAGWRALTVVHPRAVVSTRATLADGVQVMAGAVVQCGVSIARGSIVNTGAIVDHDCVVGPYCHIAPGAVLSGGVRLDECCHIGTGASVVQGVSLGARTIVGAGACVVRDHAGQQTLVGVPAKSRSLS